MSDNDLIRRGDAAVKEIRALLASDPDSRLFGISRDTLEDIAALPAVMVGVREAQLESALRLIELIGYREGEEFGWINAHMRGVASSALSGQSIAHYWRLFPNHRPPAALRGEGV
jgi:hypothetical protein